MGVIKKTICYAVLAMLFISGSTWGGEADEHISQFMEMVSKMEIDQKVEYRFSFHAPGEELSDANEIIAYLDQTPERVMVIAEESIGSVFGKERFQAAEYAIKTDDISDGEEVYLYDGLPFLDVALQMNVVNHTNEVLECSYWRALEVCLDGVWYQLDAEAAWILSSERVDPGASMLMEDSWVLEHYPVGEGRYRILTNMWFGEAAEESFYRAYEFSIE